MFDASSDRASQGMRWQDGPDRGTDEVTDVLDDLEMQAEGLHLADRAVEVDELSTAQYAEVELAARVLASIGCDVRVSTDGPDVEGRVADVGASWMRVDHAGGGASFVQLDRVVMVAGLADRAVAESSRPLASRLSLRSVLRRIADEHVPCTVHLAGGRVLQGDVVRVGADFVELRHLGGGQVTVRLAAIAVVRDRS